MMSIRARVALLSLIAVLGVLAALLAQYFDIQSEVDSLRQQKISYLQAQTTSSLIHQLQKERGLSAGLLADPSPSNLVILQAQYRETDAVSAHAAGFAEGEQFPALRQRVVAGQVGWRETRDFYTHAIDELLAKITAEIVVDESDNARMRLAIVELALARENMGLMRATVNGIYSKGADDLDDILFLSSLYSRYIEHLGMFRRIDGDRGEVMPTPYPEVIGQVGAILAQGPGAHWGRSPLDWWRDSTWVIDRFKSREDELYARLLTAADVRVADKEAELRRYGMVAVGIGGAVILMAMLTILRILKALGVLITTLDDIVRSENYSVRIRGESPRDEFGRISLSLNNLLNFTDSLIRDKEKLAATDLLTGIANRRSFLERAAQEVRRVGRYDSGFALVFVDIDHFKRINDEYGHATGDAVLVHLVKVMKQALRETDLFARWGGEEFVILVPESTLEQSRILAEKLCREVEQAVFPVVHSVTCSMGVAEWVQGESLDSLCQRADTALYQAKESGRNQVCVAR